MAAGPAPLGLLYFAGVKFAGYCAAAHYANRRFNDRKANVYLAGATRTLIGLAAGVGSLAFLSFMRGAPGSDWLFFVFLVPIRYCEWQALLWIFYRKPFWDSRAMRSLTIKGIVWSFCLDLPAILSVFVLPGGAWIC